MHDQSQHIPPLDPLPDAQSFHADTPNAETLAAMAEVDEMIRTGTGQHFRGDIADFFAMLDAEDMPHVE